MTEQPLETPFEEEVDETETKSWEFSEGDEIVPGRHALNKLGGGSDYEAYLAWDDALAYLVVAKVLRPHLVENEKSQKSLAREAEALGRLNHPLLVRGYGAVLAGPRPHVVMEHLEGPHLARLIRRYGPLPLEQLIPLAVSLCSVTHYLGEQKIVHLDIKPRNVVVSVTPKLIDLSVARSFSRAERIKGHVGTDLYMAPEQCDQSFGTIGAAADVWGLGVTLYHAAAGRRPFERDAGYDENDVQQRFPQITAEPETLDPKVVPPIVGDAVLSCLRKDPEARPAPMEVAHELEPVLAALPRRHRLGKLRPRFR